MSWTVRILKTQDPQGRTVFDVVATNDAPLPGENPDLVVGCYPDRLKAVVAGRLFAQRHSLRRHEAKVIPFPRDERVA